MTIITLPLQISLSAIGAARGERLRGFSVRKPQYRNIGPLLRNNGGLNLVGAISGRMRIARIGQVSECSLMVRIEAIGTRGFGTAKKLECGGYASEDGSLLLVPSPATFAGVFLSYPARFRAFKLTPRKSRTPTQVFLRCASFTLV